MSISHLCCGIQDHIHFSDQTVNVLRYILSVVTKYYDIMRKYLLQDLKYISAYVVFLDNQIRRKCNVEKYFGGRQESAMCLIVF